MGVAACGGDSADDKLSKTDLAKEANAICTDFRQEIAKLPRAQARTAEAIAAAVGQTRTILRRTVTSLEELEPEDAVTRDWENYVDKERDAVRLLDTFLEQVTKRDRHAQQTLMQINAVVDQERIAALKLGADACASKPAAGQVPGNSAP